MPSDSVLVIAAHPDDEVLGCGGTIARLAAAGRDVHIAILGEGITSRSSRRDEGNAAAVATLGEACRRAGAVLGARSVRTLGLPDNRFDGLELLDIVKLVEQLIAELSPREVFTQHGGDLNIDHGVVFRATLTATRPMAGSTVQAVYAYEVPSSTEWAFQRITPVFRPNVFQDIEGSLDRKIEAMACYDGELRQFPHPRSAEGLTAIARRWGSVSGFRAAEAFELIRDVRR